MAEGQETEVQVNSQWTGLGMGAAIGGILSQEIWVASITGFIGYIVGSYIKSLVLQSIAEKKAFRQSITSSIQNETDGTSSSLLSSSSSLGKKAKRRLLTEVLAPVAMQMVSAAQSDKKLEKKAFTTFFQHLGFDIPEINALYRKTKKHAQDALETLAAAWELQAFTQDERTLLMEGLYRIAFADGELHSKEEKFLEEVGSGLELHSTWFVVQSLAGRSEVHKGYQPRKKYTHNEAKICLGLNKTASKEEQHERHEALWEFYNNPELPNLKGELNGLCYLAKKDLSRAYQALNIARSSSSNPKSYAKSTTRKPATTRSSQPKTSSRPTPPKPTGIKVSDLKPSSLYEVANSQLAKRAIVKDFHKPKKEYPQIELSSLEPPLPPPPISIPKPIHIEPPEEQVQMLELQEPPKAKQPVQEILETPEIEVKTEVPAPEELLDFSALLEEAENTHPTHVENIPKQILEELLGDLFTTSEVASSEKDPQPKQMNPSNPMAFMDLVKSIVEPQAVAPVPIQEVPKIEMPLPLLQEPEIAIEFEIPEENSKDESDEPFVDLMVSQGQAWWEKLRGLDQESYQEVIEEFVRQGPQALEQLLPYFGDYLLQAGIREILQKMGPKALAFISETLHEQHPDQQEWMLELLPSLGGDSSRYLLIDFLQSDHYLLQYRAEQGLSSLGYQTDEIERLKKLPQHDSQTL